MRELSPDVLALAAFGQIIPQSLLDLPPLGPINVHGSLLPKYRGAAPIQRAIMAGETETGVTTMWMDATLDTGDMLLEALPAHPARRYGGNADAQTGRAGRESAGAKRSTAWQAGTLAAPQAGRQPGDVRARPSAGRRHIAGKNPRRVICNRIRGVSPSPGAYSQIKGKRVKIWAAQPHLLPEILNSVILLDVETAFLPAPGTVLAIQKSPPGLLVEAGEGTAVC